VFPCSTVNLGAALYEQRDFVGAVRAFETALHLNHDDVTARLNLANALSEVCVRVRGWFPG